MALASIRPQTAVVAVSIATVDYKTVLDTVSIRSDAPEIDEIVFAVTRKKLDEMEQLFLLCEELGIRTRVAMNFFQNEVARIEIEELELDKPQDGEVLIRYTRAIDTGEWDRLDEDLKSYAQLASAGVIGCSWCLDFGYFKAHNDGLDLAKVREVPRWRESDRFTDTERAVLEYAEAMSTTPLGVTDQMVAGLIDRLGVEAVVELTQMVALENMRSRFNSAAGLKSQGYSDVCELPLAVPSTS